MSFRRYIAVNVFALAIIVIAIIARPPTEMPKSAPRVETLPGVAWTPSSTIGPPENTPIMGYWRIDEQIVSVAVVSAGTTFYEYIDLPDAPAVPLFGYPPLYWSFLPDETRP